MYYCVCYTCEEEHVIEELDQAQEYFNEHADRECEVELRSVRVDDGPLDS